MDRVRQAMVNSARLGQHGALMFLELDHFKLLNDTLGDDVGDELLQQVAYRLRNCVREGDSVARLGGDEFVVLLEGLSDNRTDAANHRPRWSPTKFWTHWPCPTACVATATTAPPASGLWCSMEDHETMDDLLKKADICYRHVPGQGSRPQHRAPFFDPVMQAAVTTHAELAKEIRLGLQRHEFVLHYQVQIEKPGPLHWRRGSGAT